MKNKAGRAAWLLGLGLLASGPASAGLEVGMLYDEVLNITWLKDANYAKTSGYDSDGRMTWAAAKTWADQLTYGGYSDWRLASNTPVGANWNYSRAANGTTDVGYNITSTHSELSYMYYVNLGLDGFSSPSGWYQPTWGIFENGTSNGTDDSSVGQRDVGPVDNLQSFAYWSGTAYAPDPTNGAWYFRTDYGYQDIGDTFLNELYAWAVRPGNAWAPPTANEAPEPGSLVLAGLGLAWLVLARRCRALGAS